MKNLENIIILILLLAIGSIYIKNNKEYFLAKFQPYYPITTEVNPRFNNYNNTIEDKRLDVLKNALNSLRIESNNGSLEIKEFNKINLPVMKKILALSDIKSIIDFLLEKINSILGDSYTLILEDVKDINKYETENEVKINFRLICKFKIKTLQHSNYNKSENIGNIGENKLIILSEILSKRNYDKESIYLNYIQIAGLTGGNFLPGKNYYDDNNNLLISDFETNKIIENKLKLNSDEVNNLNINKEDVFIQKLFSDFKDEEDVIKDITIDESINEGIINTEEAESFFNL